MQMHLFQQRGFSYLIALFLIASLSILSVRAVENIATKEQREKEAQLLWVGQAYQTAIRHYYENSPGMTKKYPRELHDLLLDQRSTKIMRPLRKLYRDPITHKENWGIVRSEDGGVMGVFSLSEKIPFKKSGFPMTLTSFTNAKSYQDWKFSYQP
jgi:type II secretory pathway pseudopilin PulG